MFIYNQLRNKVAEYVNQSAKESLEDENTIPSAKYDELMVRMLSFFEIGLISIEEVDQAMSFYKAFHRDYEYEFTFAPAEEYLVDFEPEFRLHEAYLAEYVNTKARSSVMTEIMYTETMLKFEQNNTSFTDERKSDIFSVAVVPVLFCDTFAKAGFLANEAEGLKHTAEHLYEQAKKLLAVSN